MYCHLLPPDTCILKHFTNLPSAATVFRLFSFLDLVYSLFLLRKYSQHSSDTLASKDSSSYSGTFDSFQNAKCSNLHTATAGSATAATSHQEPSGIHIFVLPRLLHHSRSRIDRESLLGRLIICHRTPTQQTFFVWYISLVEMLMLHRELARTLLFLLECLLLKIYLLSVERSIAHCYHNSGNFTRTKTLHSYCYMY